MHIMIKELGILRRRMADKLTIHPTAQVGVAMLLNAYGYTSTEIAEIVNKHTAILAYGFIPFIPRRDVKGNDLPLIQRGIHRSFGFSNGTSLPS